MQPVSFPLSSTEQSVPADKVQVGGMHDPESLNS